MGFSLITRPATDAQGNALAGATTDAAAAYDAAQRAFSLYTGDPLAELDRALMIAPRFGMARLLKAWLLTLATEPEAAAEARRLAASLRDWPLGERERSHLAALDLVLAGEWTRGADALARHSMTWPRDLAALQAGHLIDFYRAGARELRDRIARALPAWGRGMPGRSALLGMHAFGLEECGAYAAAEETGRAAIEAEPLDCWAHHAVTHVMEMQGRPADGIAWMAGREAHWAGEGNFFQVHNWWHRALFHLDLEEADRALALYDGPVRGARSEVALDLVDASALLWRVWTQGVDVGDRWVELSSAWDAHADGRLYPFNDWHAAMAYLGAGRAGEVDRLLAAYRGDDPSEVAGWARRTGAALIEGFAAFAAGRHERAVEHLMGARAISGAFGGSHAQRDVIDWTLTEAAVRARLPAATALASERLALKPHSPVNAAFLRRAQAPLAAAS